MMRWRWVAHVFLMNRCLCIVRFVSNWTQLSFCSPESHVESRERQVQRLVSVHAAGLRKTSGKDQNSFILICSGDLMQLCGLFTGLHSWVIQIQDWSSLSICRLQALVIRKPPWCPWNRRAKWPCATKRSNYHQLPNHKFLDSCNLVPEPFGCSQYEMINAVLRRQSLNDNRLNFYKPNLSHEEFIEHKNETLDTVSSMNNIACKTAMHC